MRALRYQGLATLPYECGILFPGPVQVSLLATKQVSDA